MKLIIQERLSINITSSVVSDIPYFIDLARVCDEYSIAYILDYTDKYIDFIVLPQKCCLDEFDMNYLFDSVIRVFEYSIEYAWLGGKGCDFAINLFSKE